MTSINKLAFNGSETTGSVAKTPIRVATCPTEEPCDSVNFKGKEVVYYGQQPKRKNSFLKTVLVVGGLAAATIGGLGYAHKTEAIKKLKDGKIKNWLTKLEPAAEKCYGWCHTLKTKTVECWNKIKGFFSSKKS